MFDVGRVCVKIAGRDAGQKCVVVDVLEGKYVLIDGMTRRKKCNTLHLEPLADTLEIEKNASHEEVVKAFKKLGLEVKSTNKKHKAEKPKQTRKVTTRQKAPAKEKKPKAEKKEKPAKEDKKASKKKAE